MKILYVITKSNFGGAQRYVYDLATHLPQGYESVVALGGTGARSASPGTLKRTLEDAGVRTLVVPHFVRDMSLADDIRAFFELWHIVRTERPDVLHVTSSKAGGLGALVGRLCGLNRIVFTSHGLTFDEIWRPAWQRMLIYWFTWFTICLSTHTVLISTDTYTRARRMPFVKKKITLIHNGIEAPSFLEKGEARRFLLPTQPDSLYAAHWLGIIAELHPNKNISTLIDALAILTSRNSALHLVVIGEGEERTRLEDQARASGVADRIHLVGYVRNAARYLTAFDFFTLPSLKEGLPYVLMEAGFAGLPCVVSNIPANTELVTHEQTGLVVKAAAEHLANAFEQLITTPELARTYGDALRSEVARKFNVNTMVRHTMRLYSDA